MHLVHNPAAGDEEHNRKAILRLIERFGHDVEYHDVNASGWEETLAAGAELIAVAGGDGTVGHVARLLAGTGLPIAVLPLGTANNISVILGFADVPLEELVSGWDGAQRRALDIGVARGPWGTFRFLESIGVGALAESMAEVSRGSAAHVDHLEAAEARIAAALELIGSQMRRTPAARLEISIDGSELSGEYMLMEVFNLGIVGPNLQLAPHADPSDGLLDVVVAGEDLRRKLADDLSLFRDPARAPDLCVRRGTHLQIRCEGLTVHMDDELWDVRSGRDHASVIDVTVENRALTFIVPSSDGSRNSGARALSSGRNAAGRLVRAPSSAL